MLTRPASLRRSSVSMTSPGALALPGMVRASTETICPSALRASPLGGVYPTFTRVPRRRFKSSTRASGWVTSTAKLCSVRPTGSLVASVTGWTVPFVSRRTIDFKMSLICVVRNDNGTVASPSTIPSRSVKLTPLVNTVTALTGSGGCACACLFDAAA